MLLAVFCLALTVLQFRWTAELSTAELESLKDRQEVAARGFCSEFDSELRLHCEALVPGNSREIGEEDFARRVREWNQQHSPLRFSRMAIARPSGASLELKGIDLVTGAQQPQAWPDRWAALESNLLRKSRGGSPPFADPEGLLLEFPIRGGHGTGAGSSRASGPAEAGWFILEIDRDDLRNRWLPQLAQKHFDQGGSFPYRIEVISRNRRNALPIFEMGPRDARENPIQMSFHFQGQSPDDRTGRPQNPLWTLVTHREAGALETIAAASKRRNLTLAMGVNALIFAAGLALVRQTRKSRRLAEAQVDFVAGVSHELRTPITVIRGAAHNLKRGIVREPEAIHRYAGMILQHAEQLDGMVQQVLDYSTTKQRGHGSKPTLLPLQRVVETALANTAPETTGLQIDVHMAGDPVQVMADEAALIRAVQNLISNAAKYGGSDRWIGIHVFCDGEQAIVQISNRGMGIPAEEQKEIFTPFFRGSAARDAQIRGSGLGLALVKEIMEAHDGTISVSSDSRESVFTLRLPLAPHCP